MGGCFGLQIFSIMSSLYEEMNNVMNELVEVQGYTVAIETLNGVGQKKERKDTFSRRRLLPELKDFPTNPREENKNVWNPHVVYEDAHLLVEQRAMTQLPTNPDLEIVRRRCWERFKEEFYQIVDRFQKDKLGSAPPMTSVPAFLEKWHMDCQTINRSSSKLQLTDPITTTSTITRLMGEIKETVSDPIFFDPKKATAAFSKAALAEYENAWKTKMSGKRLVQELDRLAKILKPVRKAIGRLCNNTLDSWYEKTAPNKLQTSKKRPRIRTDTERDQMKVSYQGLSFFIHHAHFEKLQRLYDRAAWHIDFESSLFCLLCRYDMLQGAGLQSAIPAQVHNVLFRLWNVRMECFASPLNSRYSNFGCAFDLDAIFGGLGSFFTLELKTGCFQANPPFANGVVTKMTERMNELLQSQEPLMFIVFLPVWKNASGYQLLHESQYLTKHVTLANGRHFYAEGSQFRRQASFRAASFDTSIVFLQNESARNKWPVTQEEIKALREAFERDPRDDQHQDKRDFLAQKVTARSTTREAATDSTAGSVLRKELPILSASVGSKRKSRKKQGSRPKKRLLVGNEEKDQIDILASMGLAVPTIKSVAEFKQNPKKRQR